MINLKYNVENLLDIQRIYDDSKRKDLFMIKVGEGEQFYNCIWLDSIEQLRNFLVELCKESN